MITLLLLVQQHNANTASPNNGKYHNYWHCYSTWCSWQLAWWACSGIWWSDTDQTIDQSVHLLTHKQTTQCSSLLNCTKTIDHKNGHLSLSNGLCQNIKRSCSGIQQDTQSWSLTCLLTVLCIAIVILWVNKWWWWWWWMMMIIWHFVYACNLYTELFNAFGSLVVDVGPFDF